MRSELPIEEVLPDLKSALTKAGQAVVQAPPGAGKTTRIPLFLLESKLYSGRILMLEPRRLAAKSSAQHMAHSLGEKTGETVGYRIKGETRTSKATRIEIITEGILTRMIQSDPELSGVSCVIFDEFHERSLQADLGLALCLEIRAALREDLHLLVMSATLDAEPVARLLGDAPLVTSQGQSFPVEIKWLDRPWKRPGQRGPRFESAVHDIVLKAISETEGDVLVFLPGEGEIRRVQGLLSSSLGKDVSLHTLFGAMDFKAQQAAILPATQGRKLVLATSIAETSLTIEGIKVVIDGGLARRARFDAGSGMSRLVSEKVTKAEATQRTGRAGRLSSGTCYRLWTKGEEGGLAPFPPAEIEAADLTGLVLELALWGEQNPENMSFLTQPRRQDFQASQLLLRQLGALDENNRITDHGRQIARTPLHPRLGHMLALGGPKAPLLAAMLGERDPIERKGPAAGADLELRWKAVADPGTYQREHPHLLNKAAIQRIRTEAKRLKSSHSTPLSLGAMAALAFPDRIGLRRAGEAPRYLLSGGKGAYFADGDAMRADRMIVALDLDGDQREAKIRLAVAITTAEVREIFATEITEQNICFWSKRDNAVLARCQTRLGAVILADKPWKACPQDAMARALLEGIRETGLSILPWNKAARRALARIEWLRARGADMPDCSEPGLLEQLEIWLLPHLGSARKPGDLKQVDLLMAIQGLMTWEQTQQLDRLAPASFTAPTGTRIAIDYTSSQPMVSVRLQELFGLTGQPTVGPDRLPLLLELLSPARRPVQTTADLPGFWASSYSDVRKDMRGRYPKHPWPEDPTKAEPTRRVKAK